MKTSLETRVSKLEQICSNLQGRSNQPGRLYFIKASEVADVDEEVKKIYSMDSNAIIVIIVN